MACRWLAVARRFARVRRSLTRFASSAFPQLWQGRKGRCKGWPKGRPEGKGLQGWCKGWRCRDERKAAEGVSSEQQKSRCGGAEESCERSRVCVCVAAVVGCGSHRAAGMGNAMERVLVPVLLYALGT